MPWVSGNKETLLIRSSWINFTASRAKRTHEDASNARYLEIFALERVVREVERLQGFRDSAVGAERLGEAIDTLPTHARPRQVEMYEARAQLPD